ncbi:hypothetical protein K0M31_010849 [Melipona bicolor]|uniref:Uncharacterized protein n=1 Tax=Melipona bicolor TaxID=60889 RepID=A0AA40KI70_9HYME|nr:hypothetical protein K0M31_010849 [Melipona bicolor]
MAKRKLPKEVYYETENSDEEFYFNSLNTDIKSDNVCSDSGSDIVPVKRRLRQYPRDSEEEANDEREQYKRIYYLGRRYAQRSTTIKN